MFKNVIKNVRRFGKKVTIKAIDKAPQLLFGFGVVAFGATIYLSIKAAPKVNEELGDCAKKAKEINAEDDISETELVKEINRLYKNTFFRVIKIVAKPVGMGVITLGLFGGSEYIVFRRLGEASAKYMVLEKTFDNYRANVVDEEGEEKDRHYMFNTRKKKIGEGVTLNEDGTTEEDAIEIEEGDTNDLYYSWCKETSGAYSGSELYDDNTILAKEKVLSKMLDDKGIITDNDILSELRMYEQVKMNGLSGLLYGQKAELDEGNKFKFEVHKIWVPDYTKKHGSKLVYQLRWKREKL